MVGYCGTYTILRQGPEVLKTISYSIRMSMKGILALRRTLSLVDMIINTKISNCPIVVFNQRSSAV